MMDNGFGVNFAPTGDNAMNGDRNGQLSGVPQAIQILSLALPKVAGVKAIAPQQLLSAPGGQGMDPSASALFQTIMKTLGLHAMGLPGGTAGPNPPELRPGPYMPPTQPDDAMPTPFAPRPPRIIAQPNPGGTAGPNPGGFDPNAPFAPTRRPFEGFQGPRRGPV